MRRRRPRAISKSCPTSRPPARRWTSRRFRRPEPRRTRSRRISPASSCRADSRSGSMPSCPTPAIIAVGPQGVVTFVGTRKSKVWAVTDRDKDRVADEVKEFAPSISFRHSQRRVLLEGWFPLHRRAEPRAGLSRRRVLLRRPRRRRLRRRQAGRADPAGGGILQPHRAGVPHRAGRQALHHARTAVQRVRAGKDGPLQEDRHRRHRAHEPGRQGPGGVRHRRAQLGRHGLQSEGQGALVHRQPGRRHGRQPAARRAQPRRQGRA